MRDVADILNVYRKRKSDRAPAIAQMKEVSDTYSGKLVVPLPEMDRDEKAAVANLVQQGIDQTGMRVASTMFSLEYPALRPGIKISEKKARVRRDATLGWHARAGMGLKIRRRARFLLAYGTSPVLVKPRMGMDDQKNERYLPWWDIRDPLGTFPAACLDPEDLVPPDVIFSYIRGREWLESMYPDQLRRLKTNDSTSSFEVVEYIDADECVTFVVGDPASASQFGGEARGTPHEVLERYPNRAEMPLCVMPGRITLGGVMGQFNQMIGMYEWQAKVMALNLIGTERSIFPESWLVVPQGGTGEIIVQADAREGVIGVVEGGSLTNVSPGVGPYASQTMSQLEYNQRATGSVPSEFGGQAGSNVRTGKRGSQVLSAAVDFPIQEIQEIIERSVEAENRIAVATAKAYEKRSVSLHVPGRGAVEYTPEHFESDVNFVRYAYAGADANGLTIQVGQKIGLETISRHTAMELDPLIKDVELEHDRILAEKVETAFWSSVQTMAADPNSPLTPLDLANLANLIVTDKMDSYAAFDKVHQDAQKRQAEKMAADAAAAQGPPGMPPGPEGMPGVQGPAGASPEAQPSIGAPAAGVTNLSSLMTQLRRPNMPLAAEGMAGV